MGKETCGTKVTEVLILETWARGRDNDVLEEKVEVTVVGTELDFIGSCDKWHILVWCFKQFVLWKNLPHNLHLVGIE